MLVFENFNILCIDFIIYKKTFIILDDAKHISVETIAQQ